MAEIRRIGLLTSGGDCAGLNTVIHAVAARAVRGHGWEVVGIREGVHGLMMRPVAATPLDPDALPSAVFRTAGTILGSANRNDPFAYPKDGRIVDRSDEVIDGYRMLDLDALIGVGGDGSLRILRRLAAKGGIPFVGIPKTIDNDVAMTELAIGYITAVNVATEALDRLQPTAASHSRIMILEVMGRDAGHIALAAGIAGNADAILIPEIPYSMEALANHILEIRRKGRNFALVVVAEAVRTVEGQVLQEVRPSGIATYGGIGGYFARRLAELTGADTRVTVLGHVQRGAEPVALDRVIAAAFGVRAVDLIAEGRFDRMVAWQNRTVVDVALATATEHSAAVNVAGTMVKTARGLGTYVGEFA
jgi:6-phosphofructokinase 1